MLLCTRKTLVWYDINNWTTGRGYACFFLFVHLFLPKNAPIQQQGRRFCFRQAIINLKGKQINQYIPVQHVGEYFQVHQTILQNQRKTYKTDSKLLFLFKWHRLS